MEWPPHLLVLASAGLASIGCGKLLGTGDYETVARQADAGRTTIQFKDATCRACMQSCAPEIEKCNADAACRGWETRMAACAPDDGVCEHAAFASLTATNGAMGDVSACTLERCYDACAASSFFPAKSAECGPAIRSKCDAAASDCSKDSRCVDFARCMFEFDCVVRPDPDCFWRCADRTGAYEPTPTPDAGLGQTSTLTLGLCEVFSTSAECGIGTLECAGHGWTAANARTIDVTVVVSDAQIPEFAGAPMSGVDVRVCKASDVACLEPGITKKTSPDGRATFSIDVNHAALPFYFEVTPGWPNGPSKLLFDTTRPLRADTVLTLATYAPLFAHVKESSYAELPWGGWSDKLGTLAVMYRDCDNTASPGLELNVDPGDAGGTPHIAYWDMIGNPLPGPAGALGATIAALEPGLHAVWATRNGVEVARHTVVVKADSVTSMHWFGP